MEEPSQDKKAAQRRSKEIRSKVLGSQKSQTADQETSEVVMNEDPAGEPKFFSTIDVPNQSMDESVNETAKDTGRMQSLDNIKALIAEYKSKPQSSYYVDHKKQLAEKT